MRHTTQNLGNRNSMSLLSHAKAQLTCVCSIIRILFMIPIYAAISVVSYKFYRHAIYWEVLRDCYEAFAIASFFTLLCHYVEPTLHEQKNYFRKLELKNWVWPFPWMQKCTGGQEKGLLRKPRSGLTWFNVSLARSGLCHTSRLTCNRSSGYASFSIV
jgi:hypothetical protein